MVYTWITYIIISLYISPYEVNVGDVFRIWSRTEYPTVLFIEDTIRFLDRDTIFVGFAVVPYTTPSGDYWIRLFSQDEVDSIPISVLQTEFPAETLFVPDTMVRFSPETAKRVREERKETLNVLSRVLPFSLFSGEFVYPLPDVKITSPFGVRRYMNNEARGFHRGIDLRAKKGDRIVASNDGVVVLAREHYLPGKSVVIDHGLGIHTYYAHLDTILVSEGDTVKINDIIGYAGETGRVTGTHLHFGLYINSHPANPPSLLHSY